MLLSILFHALGVLAIVVVPAAFTGHALMKPEPERETIRYVQMTPRVDRSARPKRPAEMSDIDRKSGYGIIGNSVRPSAPIPCRIARANCASLQRPAPVSGSGLMFGAVSQGRLTSQKGL